MKSGRLRGFYTVLTLASLFAAPLVVAAPPARAERIPGDVDLTKHLVDHSPWSGGWEFSHIYAASAVGTLDIVFTMASKEPGGRIENTRTTTGARFNFDGPISRLTVEGGVISFYSTGNTLYELQLKGDKLVGHSFQLGGRVDITLSSAKPGVKR
jgi:hypothetical protein